MNLQTLSLPLKISNQSLYLIISLGIGITFYFLILLFGLPELLNQFFLETNNLTIFIITIFAVLYFAYLPNGWIGILTSFTATLVLFSLQLSQQWQSLLPSSIGNGYIFSGLLPLNDANIYYTSALRLLQGETFTDTGSLRPLSHGAIATILGLTQENLQITLAIIVLITAISCFFLAREIKKYQGTIGSAIILTLMFAFIRPYIGSVATENLGLAVGALATAAMWRGLHSQKLKICLFGLFLLTIALNIRAGVFFILPLFLAWSVWFFKEKSQLSSPFVFGGISVILLGFILNSLVFKLVALPGIQPNGNFAHVLYGMTVGGNWTSILTDHPEIHNSQQRYQIAFEALLNNPLALPRGFLRAWDQFFLQDFAFSFLRSNSINFSLQILSLVAIFYCLHQWRTAMGSFMLMGLFGVLLSLPFAPPWDAGTRIYAATIPFFALFPTVGLTYLCRKFKLSVLTKTSQIDESPQLLINFSMGLIIFMIVGTMITKIVSHTPKFSEIICPQSLETAYFFNSAGSSINVVANNVQKKSYIPIAKVKDFKESFVIYKSDKNFKQFFDYMDELQPNRSLISKINLANNQGIWVITDTNII